MQNLFRRISPLAFLTIATSILAISCLNDLSGPAYRPGFLALAPSFESSASGIVDVDSVHVILIRDEDETVTLDTVVALTIDSDSVDLSFTIPVSSSSETFTLTLECISPTGEVVFSAGPLTVTATTSGDDNVVAEDVPITYVGVGSDAVDIDVPGDDIFYINMSDTLTLEAQALDDAGVIIAGTPVKWTSGDTTIVRFPDPAVGLMEAGQIRGWVDVTAELLTGPSDIVEVYVEPVPSQITVFSGNDQTGLVGTELPLVLEVQVNAPDGPVEAAMVDFTTGDGGSFTQASTATDAEGYAWTTWTLGQSPGLQTATATVRDWPALQATFTANADDQAGGINWTGTGGDALWSNPDNWDLGRIPNSLDAVYITQDVGTTVELRANATVAYLYVGDAANVETQRIDMYSSYTLQVDSAAVIAESGYLQLDGCFLAGAGAVTVRGELYCLACAMIGPGSTNIEAGATLVFDTGEFTATLMDNRLISNDGTIQWAGSEIVMENGAQVVNNSTMQIRAENTMTLGVTGLTSEIINNGTLMRSSTETVTTIGVPVTSNANSSLQITSGILLFAGNTNFVDAAIEVGDGGTSAVLTFASGTHTIDAQSMVTMGPDGTFQVMGGSLTMAGSYDYTGAATSLTQVAGGTVTFNNSSTAVVPNLVLSGGTLEGTGTILVADVLSWTGGILQGTGVLRINTQASASIGGTGLELNQRVFDNQGTILVTGEGPTFSNGAVLNNLATGTIDINGDFSMLGTGTINNAGEISKSYTTGSSTRFSPAVNNNGTIEVQGGTMAFEGTFSHADGAVVQGNGTIDLPIVDDVLAFDGDVNPGTSPGILNFIGDAMPSAQSSANIEIGGLDPGTQYDRVTVDGDFAADGTVNISIINGFPAADGNVFTVLTFTGTQTGDFADYNVTGLDAGLELVPQWNSASLDLVVTPAPPGPGEQILFFSEMDDDIGVFAATSDGTTVTRVATTGYSANLVVAPRWSQEEQLVAYTHDNGASTGPNSLYLIDLASGDSAEVVTDRNTGYPQWSHNGSHLGFICTSAVAGIDDVCVIPDLTTPITALTPNSYTVATTTELRSDFGAGPAAAAWDPDPVNRDRFIVARDTAGGSWSKFFSARYDGTNVEEITDAMPGGGLDYLQVEAMDVWSNGITTTIVFSGYDSYMNTNKLYVVNTDGTGFRQLTFLPGALDKNPLFSPDGSEVMFSREDDNCTLDYWIVDINSSPDFVQEEQITTQEFSCEFGPGLPEETSYDWSPDGNQIAFIGSDGVRSRVYVVPRLNLTDRVLVGRDRDNFASWLREYQPRWRP
jgi:hypothetical protein